MLIKEDIPSQTLQNNLPHQHEWIIKDPITQALVSFYQEYSQEISSLQQQMKENIDGSFDNPQENPTLLLLCQNQTFTKLHSIYELITYQRMPISLINFLQIGSIFHVYLYCPEISLNFSHHSESLEMSCEMVKYQCIFALYKRTCKNLLDILHLMKQGLEKKIQYCLEPLKKLSLKPKKSPTSDDFTKLKRTHDDSTTNIEAFEILQKKIHGESQIKGV